MKIPFDPDMRRGRAVHIKEKKASGEANARYNEILCYGLADADG